MARSGSILGNPVLRLEDPALLTGAAEYVDDLRFVGLAHVTFVRSTVAHARLVTVDTATAAGMPGVLAVYSAGADDLALAADAVVRHDAGDAQSPGVRDGHRQIRGGHRRRRRRRDQSPGQSTPPRRWSPSTSRCRSSPRRRRRWPPMPRSLFPEHGSNVCFATAFGDDADALEGADVVAEVTMVSQRLAGVPMEPNGCVAGPDAEGDRLTCWISHQAPTPLHADLARGPRARSRASCGSCAPGSAAASGQKQRPISSTWWRRRPPSARPARQMGRDRSENMVSLVHGRDYTMNGKLGLTNDGRFVGLDAAWSRQPGRIRPSAPSCRCSPR